VENGDSSVNPADNKQAQSKESETPVKAAKLATNGLETPSQPVASVVNGTETTTSTGKPRKLRGSRIGGKSNMKVGFFVKEEVAKLEAFKVAFCNTHGFSDHKKFDEMIQHSERDGGDWPCPADVCTKSEFWTEIYNLVPDRDRRSLYRFMRRHFQDSTQKPHEWTEDQDKELVALMSQHKGKWAYVAKLLGRSDDDVTQRWKNQLEHRGKMNRGKWGEEELRSLLDEIQKVWDRVYASDGDAAGKDMYELEEKHLRWGIISDQLGNVRSRQQCADKWRKIRRSVEQMRACGNPDAIYDPIEAVNKRTRWGSGSVTPKSTWLVGEDDDDEGSKGDNGTPAPINGLGISGDVSQVPVSEKKPLPEAPASPQPTTEQDSQADNNPEVNSAAISRPNRPGEQQQPAPETAVVSDDEAKAERKAAKKAEKEKRKRERREQSKVDALVAELGESAQKEKSDKKDDKPRTSLIDTNTAGPEAEATLTTSTPLKKKKRKSTAINGVAPDEPKSPESHKKKKKKSTQEIAK
jgi:hypothetical protein